KCLAEAADCSPWSGDSCCKPYLCSCIFFYPCSCRPKGW
nr:Chain A, ACTX-Hi:OB4219 [Hadronyche infensa]1KQI_A Chain A, ACTX-Hi:OB4219 [Hadronyche infensa]